MPYRRRMGNDAEPKPPTKSQTLKRRILWSLAGAVVNYLLIALPFKYLNAHTDWPTWLKSACSAGVGAVFFFFWNYFVNFRTDSRKRDALARYLLAVGCMWALSTATLTLLKHFNAHLAFNLGRFPLDLDIVATQFFLSGLKFFLYHVWVFPLPKEPAIGKGA